MVFGESIDITHDAFVNFEETGNFDFEAGLFANLTPQRLFEALTDFDDSTRQRPPALERLIAALDQQNPVTFDDESPDTEDRTLGILAANTATLP